MQSSNNPKPASYYEDLIAEMVNARTLYPPVPIGRNWMADDIYKAQHGTKTQVPPENAEERLAALSKAPLQDQIIAVLKRDKILAAEYRASENNRLVAELTKKETEHAKTVSDIRARLTQARTDLQTTREQLGAETLLSAQSKPKHGFWTSVAAFFGDITGPIGLNGREEAIIHHDLIWQGTQEAYGRKIRQLEGSIKDHEADVRLNPAYEDWRTTSIKEKIEKVPASTNPWFKQGKDWAAELELAARKADESAEELATVCDKLDRGKVVTEAEWHLYEGTHKTIAKVVGFEAARARGPDKTDYWQRAKASHYETQFSDIMDCKKPYNIWELEQARERLKKASPYGGGDGRDMHSEMMAVAKERAREALKAAQEKAKEEARERESKQRKTNEEIQAAAQQALLIHLNFERFLAMELNRISAELEAEAERNPYRHDQSRGRSRGMSM